MGAAEERERGWHCTFFDLVDTGKGRQESISYSCQATVRTGMSIGMTPHRAIERPTQNSCTRYQKPQPAFALFRRDELKRFSCKAQFPFVSAPFP
jgi:hypothetical protein